MIDGRQQIERAIQAVSIRSACSFSWFGQPSDAPAREVRALMSPAAARRYLMSRLQQRLYSDFYLSGLAIPRRRERTALSVPDASTFVAGLEAANAGGATWSPGWTEIDRRDDVVVVRGNELDLTLRVQPDDVDDSVDGEVSLRLPAQMLEWSPGFWLALSDAPLPRDGKQLVRFYWNLRPDGAALLVHYATRMLNHARIPFHLKLLADPARYTRCDAGVLYLPENRVNTAEPIIQAIYERVRPALKPAVPSLTRLLAPGLATADDPGGDESFGSQRCRLLASAIVEAAEAEMTSLPDRVGFVIERLAENGVSVDRPYLRTAESAAQTFRIVVSPSPHPDETTTSPTVEDCRTVAIEIAGHLVGSAFWHDDGCAWLGATETVERSVPVYGTVGSNLYSGAAGIALFLTDVYGVTRDEVFQTTALGGLRHALTHLDDLPPAAITGLFTGLPGIAFAAARLAGALGMPDLLDDARRLLHGIASVPSEEDDLLSGIAGALLAVLELQHLDPDDHWLAEAIKLGERLLGRASRDAAGLSWRSGRRALTGLSHGGSGIGVALLELGVVSEQQRFLSAAQAAFDWERQHFDPDTGNWADLRRVAGHAHRSALLPVGESWCHGAPGIALARLHAARHLPDERLHEEAHIALATTQRAVNEALERGDESACLCHGLAGNAEILLDGFDALGDSALRDTALAVAATGIDRYAGDPARWPSGTYSGSTPGLMLGLAGIGRFYLRLAGASLLPILLPVAPVVREDRSCNSNGPSGPAARAAPSC